MPLGALVFNPSVEHLVRHSNIFCQTCIKNVQLSDGTVARLINRRPYRIGRTARLEKAPVLSKFVGPVGQSDIFHECLTRNVRVSDQMSDRKYKKYPFGG